VLYVVVCLAGLTGDRAALVAAILQKQRSSAAGASGRSSPADSPRVTSSRSGYVQEQQQQQLGSGDFSQDVRWSSGGGAGGLNKESSNRSIQSSLSRSSLVHTVLQRQRDKAAAATGSSGGGAGSAGEGLRPELSKTFGSARSTSSLGGASDRAAIVAAVLQQQRQSGGEGQSREASASHSPRIEASGDSTTVDRSSLVAAVLQRHRNSTSNLNSTAPAAMGRSSGSGGGSVESRGARRPSRGTLEPGTLIGETTPVEKLSSTAPRSSSAVRGAAVASLVARHQQAADDRGSNRSSVKGAFPSGANTGRLLSPRAPKLEGVKVPASLPTTLQRPLPLGASLVEKLTHAASKKK
jgi:hypothetical protein